MRKTIELQQLIKATEKLIDSNKQLTQANAEAFELIRNKLKKEEDLLAHCGKIYKFLQSKINKTWEEEENIRLLYNLITHTPRDN